MYKIIRCTLVVIFHISLATGELWLTSSSLPQCDPCPPGTYVQQDCTLERRTVCAPCPPNHYTDQWNTDRECQFCSAVCKELQYVKQECNATRNRLCECSEGHFLDVEFCLPHKECPPGFGATQQGTPESDTLCSECPPGTFSNISSAIAPCWRHTNCKKRGLKVAKKGSSTEDTVCEESTRGQCKTDVTLCEEALLRFPQAPSNWSDMFIQWLPPAALTAQQIESIKHNYNPKDQPLHLFKLYKRQNRGEDSLEHLIRDIKACEKGVKKQFGHLTVKEKHFQALMRSLPGKPVSKEDMENILKSCEPSNQIPMLLSLWRNKNGGSTLEGLKQLQTNQLPKSLRRAMKKLERFLSSRFYEKIILEIMGSQTTLVKADPFL